MLTLLRLVGPVSLLGGLLLMAGCGEPLRPVLDPAEFKARIERDNAAMAAVMEDSVSRIMQRVEQRMAEGKETTINFLAISGGGDWGAFGSGFLVGWGEAPDPQYRRPDFDAVTGVSTGALLAPFVFVGTDEAVMEVDTFYRNPETSWIKSRGLLFFMPWNPSFLTIPGLREDIENSATREFVSAMAEQSRKGKVLIISATDVDLGRQRFWGIGPLAEAAESTGDLKSVTRYMLASSAIPVAFPPVEIDDGLYIDGGVTANVFLRLNTQDPHSFLQRWMQKHPGVPVPKVRYWVIVNNQLEQSPATVQRRWPVILTPSLNTSTRSATIAQIQLLATEAYYANSRYGTNIELRVVAIPNDWRPPVDGIFEKQTMRSLSDLGRKMGADPSSWQLWAAPSGLGLTPIYAP